MSDNPTPKVPSPMRVMRAWLFRERAVRGPAAIELDVVDRQVTREEEAVSTAAGQATAIERKLQNARVAVKAALVDPKTPGVIDAGETRRIARALIGASVTAHHHRRHLEALT